VNAEGKEGAQTVLLNKRFEISPSRLLPEHSTSTAKAYYATDINDLSAPYFAMICGVAPLPRLNEIKAFMSLTNAGSCLIPLSYGTVYWPPANKNQLAIVFSRPLGGALISPTGDILKKFPETDVINLLNRLTPLLQELTPLKIAHRAISPHNIYFIDQSQTVMTLGECISAPPGYNQPLLCEPIYRSMTPPEARGEGDVSDDLYALGVTVLLLLLGKDPTQGLPPADILRRKMREGTYGLLVGSSREISPTMNEFLRGVLVDDPAERWSLDQVSMWLEGKRRSPKQSTRFMVSSRPFRFKEEEYTTAQELSYELSQHWQEATKTLSKPLTLSAWLKRNLNREEDAGKIESIVGQLARIASGKINDQNRLVSRILMTLSPQSPIFWGKNAYMADGMAAAFAMEMVQGKGTASSVLPIIRERLVSSWVKLQYPISSRLSALEQKYDSMSFFIDNPVIGYGVERCLYHLNPGLPCLSPLIAHEYVYNLADLLPALNRTVARNPNIEEIFDRHLVAFIANRLPQISQSDLEVLSNPNPSVLAVGRLSLFKQVQAAYNVVSLPELVRWFVSRSKPVIESYSSRKFQEKLQKSLEKEGESENLGRILLLLNNPVERNKDTGEFLMARQEYKRLDTEIIEIDKKYISDPSSISSVSRTLTSGLVVIIGSISLLIIGTYSYVGTF
jgi:serine/threonine protein kinase